jgi:hypothetical protein
MTTLERVAAYRACMDGDITLARFRQLLADGDGGTGPSDLAGDEERDRGPRRRVERFSPEYPGRDGQ